MDLLTSVGVLIAAYLLGSIPFGLINVKVTTGKDIRTIESGRTGGTNAMRAAGFWVGLTTAILDIAKSYFAVWLARWLMPETFWLHALAPAAAILGHNYSVFMIERTTHGKIHLRGGAGGAPCVGGSVGLWWPSIFIIIPVAALIFYFVGYASVTTLSVAVISILIFGYRAWVGLGPWDYVLFGFVSLGLLAWALRPNIKRLVAGNERIVGFRARKKKAE
jgi:glycerol-3-phosphate acyltransferase PlsY